MSEAAKPHALSSAMAQAGAGGRTFQTEALAFHEIEILAAVRLRALPGSQQTEQSSGELPADTGNCAGSDPATLCLGPSEWLVVSETVPADELFRQIREKYDKPGFFAWDNTDGIVCFRVVGEAARWLLSKHCGLDFGAEDLGGDHCAQTRFAHISVLMHYHINAQEYGTFDLFADRSLASYLWDLLANAASHACDLHEKLGTRGPGRF